MGELRAQWACIRTPGTGFQYLASRNSGLIDALSRMLLWRVPLTLAEGILACWSLGGVYRAISNPGSPLWQTIARSLPPEMEWGDIHAMLRELPPFPELSKILPWLALLAPFYLLSLWLHDAVWDHGCLWLLKGVGRTRGFRTTLVAEAEALTVGSLGALAGLLVYLPKLGMWFTVPIGCLGIFFWILRGYALAAFHGCPIWKGVLATLLHAVLLVCGTLALLLLCVVVMVLAAG
jgi:hypothetical protein